MLMVERHGGPSHYVRPDRVARTGVIPSIVGYSPGADVDAVAAAFTQYPMDLQTPAGMSGLRGWPPAWWMNFKTKFAAWRARHSAGVSGLRGLRGLRDFTPGAFNPNAGIAYPQVGAQIAPHMTHMSQMVAALQSSGLPREVVSAQAATTSERWWNQRWNG